MSWGFNDLSHFGRVFRAQFGLSPREWRRTAVKR
ncbi:helix-turn-helix domain-containing protein [Acinetobacter baumannii]